MTLDPVLARIDADLPNATERLFELMRIPSISTDPAHSGACRRAAEWLAADLQGLGFAAGVRPTPGHPMVVAHETSAGPEAPHLLFYGHYDVQPADPLALWDRDPFDPALQETAHGPVIRGRGASDDKGQLMTFVEAIRAWRADGTPLPVRITILFEGEEESGSPSLIGFLKENADELRADIALICDTGLLDSRTPAIVTRLRGMLGEEITVTGPRLDLHSGMYGGIAINPIRALTAALGRLHDDAGRVQVPGFYDGIAEPPEAVLAQWAALDFDEDAFLGAVGLSCPAGEAGRTGLEMIWSRPTAEINGIHGGYTGAGFKTVLPSTAQAKVSFRLVPGQDPDTIRAAFRDWFRARMPADVEVAFHAHGGGPGSTMDTDHPAFEAARRALSAEWPREAAYIGCGGSIPIAGYFREYLGMDALLAGFARDDDAIHSPNEKYDLDSFRRGIRSWVRIVHAIGRDAG